MDPEQQSRRRAALTRLAVMVPIALARGGQPAVTGLLSGFNQAMQRDQQFAQQQDQTAWQRQYQQTTLDRQAAAEQRMTDAATAQQERLALDQRLKFLDAVRQGAGNPDLTEEEAAQQVALYSQQAQSYGVDPTAVQQAAFVAPTRRQKARIAKGLADVEKTVGKTAFESGKADHLRMTGVVSEQFPNGMTVGEARQALAGVSGAMPTAAPEAPRAETRSLEVQAADALARGDTEAYARLMRVKREMGQADDRPRVASSTPVDPMALPPRVQTQVGSLSRSFDSLPIVKTIQKQAEAVAFSEGLNPNTTNAADDQALIYAFAKAMDPDSVVREGEYATVQKYAQSWAASFGFNAARVFTDSPFLTPQARQNMKRTIRARYLAGRGQYDNVRRSYAARINKATGRQDGEEYLTDYGAGFPAGETAPASAPAGGGMGLSYQDYLRRGR